MTRKAMSGPLFFRLTITGLTITLESLLVLSLLWLVATSDLLG